jgi:HTH-type transcriptional regulator/antitoxin MqsA
MMDMGKRTTLSSFDRCHVCNAKILQRTISQEFWIKRKLIVIEGVPAGVCEQCGERVVDAVTGKRIAMLLKDSKCLSKARTIRVPLLRYSAENR